MSARYCDVSPPLLVYSFDRALAQSIARRLKLFAVAGRSLTEAEIEFCASAGLPVQEETRARAAGRRAVSSADYWP